MDNRTGNIMVLGTAASTGKSVISIAICRWLQRRGQNVAPFKAFNVATEGCATGDGAILNVMQALQAAAAGCRPVSNMNPVLFDLGDDGGYQVLRYGQPTEGIHAMASIERTALLRSIVLDGYEQLAATHETVIIEGCGSPVEMNIRDRDLSNLWLAGATKSACILVADIERCGVFAALLGTFALMTDEEKRQVGGFVINKFQGSIDGFRDGVRFLEEQIGIPCLGVIPKLMPLRFPVEDAADSPGSVIQRNIVDSLPQEYLREIDRWTDHVFEHCDGELLLQLLGSRS